MRRELNPEIAHAGTKKEPRGIRDGPGLGKGGTGTLKVDGNTVDSHAMAHSLGGGLPWSETFSVGIDTSTSVDEKDYQVPFAFTGKLNKLADKNTDKPGE